MKQYLIRDLLAAPAGIMLLLMPIAISAAPKSPPIPNNILVTLQVVQVRSKSIRDSVSGTIQTVSLHDAMTKNEGGTATEISVLTSNDFPGVAEYKQIVASALTIQGKPTIYFANAPTRLEATPHINADGTITVSLWMEATQIIPEGGSVASAMTTRGLRTSKTFKNGETLLASDLTLSPLSAAKSGVTPDSAELLQFVTVRVLPVEVAPTTGNSALFPGIR